MKANHPNRGRSRAFTFLESIVVLLIILLIASIAIPGYLNREKWKSDSEDMETADSPPVALDSPPGK